VFLGKLLGLYCIALSIPLVVHPQTTLEIMKAIIQNRPLLFISGLMGMTAGLAIVLAHNVWSGGALPVIVTIFGWAALVKGMLLLVLSPEMEARVFIVGLGSEHYPLFYGLLLLLIRIYLTYASFHAGTRSSQ
jgi:hypothetical protein